MQDFVLFTNTNNRVPQFNSPIDPFDPDLFMAATPVDLVETFTYPSSSLNLGSDVFVMRSEAK